MFNSLKEGLKTAFSKIAAGKKLTEGDVNEALKLVRNALLEADVAYDVVENFLLEVRKKAVGENVIKSVKPVDMVIKIVHDEIVALLLADQQELNLKGKAPVVLLMVGPQGFGKTTTSVKLAAFIKNKMKKSPLVCSLDVYRPAAQEQLEVMAKKAGVESLPIASGAKPISIAKDALSFAAKRLHDVVILDTAGRLHTDAEMMNELKEIKKLTNPIEILLVCDAMLGQDAALIGKNFNDALGITGVIMSRVDADTRGGAALSMKKISGKSIKFIGTGEKINDFDVFHPDRIASSILGFGDIVTLVEKAQESVDEEQNQKMMLRMQKGIFDFNDMYRQLKSVGKLGGVAKIASMLPGIGGGNFDAMSSEITKQTVIIQSMTKVERRGPEVLNPSRISRIAKGAGVNVSDVKQLIKKFEQFKKALRQFSKLTPHDLERMQRMMNIKGN